MVRHPYPRKKGATKPTHAEKLYYLLKDKEWHRTRELVREVAHCFAVAKYALVHKNGYPIEKRRVPLSTEYEYRLME